eukprot:TRINITY_DN6330_c0_g1_i1.p1 TRINITY_DN6330_c0_g1~~TRINITY_DN6330_c0_g1_i1.p1  ORF type:complete len:972 (-),score=117.96 TRINITY_DN6330_c0_g1_i1:26-2941(-)
MAFGACILAWLFPCAVSLHSLSKDKDSALSLLRSWNPYNVRIFGLPTCYVDPGGFCVVAGQISGDGRGPVAQLPDACRPSSVLAFQVNSHGSSARVDVDVDGRIFWAGGGDTRSSVLSLAGIHFLSSVGEGSAVESSRRPLKVGNGWVPKGGFGGPFFAVHGGVCMVGGLLVNGSHGGIATLPNPCRPRRRLAFKTSSHYSAARIDVHADGSVVWRSGSTRERELSLSGISFMMRQSRRNARALELSGSWITSQKFATPVSFVQDGVCFVEGSVMSADSAERRSGLKKTRSVWRTIAELPTNCRPSRSLVFNLVANAASVRVHVQRNGLISLLPGGYNLGNRAIDEANIDKFISLSGIVFEVPSAHAEDDSVVRLQSRNVGALTMSSKEQRVDASGRQITTKCTGSGVVGNVSCMLKNQSSPVKAKTKQMERTLKGIVSSASHLARETKTLKSKKMSDDLRNKFSDLYKTTHKLKDKLTKTQHSLNNLISQDDVVQTAISDDKTGLRKALKRVKHLEAVDGEVARDTRSAERAIKYATKQKKMATILRRGHVKTNVVNRKSGRRRRAKKKSIQKRKPSKRTSTKGTTATRVKKKSIHKRQSKKRTRANETKVTRVKRKSIQNRKCTKMTSTARTTGTRRRRRYGSRSNRGRPGKGSRRSDELELKDLFHKRRRVQPGELDSEAIFEKRILERHNLYRCMHGVPPVKYSPEIARRAERWAAKLADGSTTAPSSTSFRSHIAGFAKLGENIAWNTNSAKEAVDAWYSEIQYTDDGRIKSWSPVFRQYAQLLWRDAKAIGCGRKGHFVVCQYGPETDAKTAPEKVFPPSHTRRACKESARSGVVLSSVDAVSDTLKSRDDRGSAVRARIAKDQERLLKDKAKAALLDGDDARAKALMAQAKQAKQQVLAGDRKSPAAAPKASTLDLLPAGHVSTDELIRRAKRAKAEGRLDDAIALATMAKGQVIKRRSRAEAK